MAVVAYLRVSTEAQVVQYGLETQRSDVEAWSALTGFEVAEYFTDGAISGAKDLDERPGLAAALVAVELGAEGLVVPRLDRLARSLAIQELFLVRLWNTGGRMWACNYGELVADSLDDPMLTAVRQMMGVFAQLERGMIASRLRAGRRAKQAAGGYAGYGAPPFGLRSVGGTLMADDAQAATLARIAELHASGSSLRQIGAVLDSEGRPPKRGGLWQSRQLSRILDRAA